jgi:putative NADH-flavin reductase
MATVYKKIAVLGGTGKAGKYLIRELFRQGYLVKALARDPLKMEPSSQTTEIIRGNAREYESVRNLLSGCDAVISTLGPSRNEPDTCSIAAGHILKAMDELNIHRFIEVAGLGIDTPDDNKGTLTRALVGIMKWFASAVIADRQKDYELLKNSDIRWTIVRCPMIRLTDVSQNIKTSLLDSPGKHINAADLARFLVDQLISEEFICQAPFIAN